MTSQPAAASKRFFTGVAVLVLFLAAPGSLVAEQLTSRKEEDKQLLQSIRLPKDPKRRPDEEYYHRFVIRTHQGQTFVGAYWREEGSYLAVSLDIFAVDKTPRGSVGRRLHSEGLGGEVLALHSMDLDGDGRDDLLLIHKTGGNIATTGVTLLKQTPTGFSRAFFYAGSDVLVSRDREQVRILIKANTAKKVEEFTWNPSKKTFEVTATFELLY